MGCQDQIKHHSVKLWESLAQDATSCYRYSGWEGWTESLISAEKHLTEHLWLRRPHATRRVFWESIPTDLPVTRKEYKIRVF